MDDDDPAPPSIRPIAPAAVRRIAAGQAVTDLASAVKELIDNAIDAGAKRIVVKLHDGGLEAIEVVDDGSGVPPQSRPLMAAKHATSKLRCFDDLYAHRTADSGDDAGGGEAAGENEISCAPTLGFRGEALFCLANLSRSLSVTTRSLHDGHDGLAESFDFDKEGNMIEASIRKVPRAVGTTVVVRGLFEAVPVRRVDLARRIKSQRAKLLRMMQGYAILCLGAQFTVTDVNSPKGGKSKGKGNKGKSNKGGRGGTKSEVRLATSEASKTLEARTASVLGTKFLAGLGRIEVDLSPAVAQSNGNDNGNHSNNHSSNIGDGATKGRGWKVSGLLSHAPSAPDAPTTARDLQFYGVNGRPVDLPSVSRLLGDVWRRFDPTSAETKGSGGNGNGSSSAGRKRPACVLSFDLPAGAYDVNLAPDKREVMFADEAAVAELLREGIMAWWEGQCGGRFVANEVEGRSHDDGKGRKREANKDGGSERESNAAASSNMENATHEATGQESGNDDVDNITPKLRRKGEAAAAVRGLADEGPLVTPPDAVDDAAHRATAAARDPSDGLSGLVNASVPSPEGVGDTGAGIGNASGNDEAVSDEGAMQSDKMVAAPQVHETLAAREDSSINEPRREEAVPSNGNGGSGMPSQRGWDERQLPERARQQDRRGWEQMRINFQRIEKRQLQEEVGRMLPADDDGEDEDGTGDAQRNGLVSRRPSSKPQISTSNRRVAARDSSTNSHGAVPRQAKRPKRTKKDISSVLDGFSYGAAKPDPATEDDSDDESDCEGNDADEIEATEVRRARQSGRESRTAVSHGKRNARMLVGATVTSERKRPRASAREPHAEDASLSTSRKRRAPSKSSLEEEEEIDDRDSEEEEKAETSCDSAPPPVEAVWNSFSGTRDVIAQYRNARLMARKNRRTLHSSMKRKRIDEDGEAETEQPTDGDVAEKEEPTICLKQEDFRHMSIIGQFNLGFILAKCRNNSLWILDQHACDEKFNFERLCKETVIHEQKLIAPLPLELSPSEEHTVLENMDVFERNGFIFAYDSEKEPRHRLSLTALPHSGSGGDGKKAVQFGLEDVGALCAMLGADGISSSEGYTAGFDTGVEGSRIAGVNAVRRYAGLAGGGPSQDGAKKDGVIGSSIVRLPKAIAMFASRACRGSIMIGTALSHKEQADILAKLEKTEIPWNCAHGRPTMSHVRSLAQCLLDDEKAMASHVAGPTLSVDNEV